MKIKVSLYAYVLMVSMSGAHASDGTITFSGSVNSGACSIKPESIDQTVLLGSIASHQLQSGGRSEERSVLIEFEGCDLTNLTNNTVTTTFNASPSATVPGAIGTVGSAGNIGIMMTHGGKVIELGKPTTPQPLSVGKNTLQFGAYVQGASNNTISPGDFSAVTSFTLAYQ